MFNNVDASSWSFKTTENKVIGEGSYKYAGRTLSRWLQEDGGSQIYPTALLALDWWSSLKFQKHFICCHILGLSSSRILGLTQRWARNDLFFKAKVHAM